jgi:hypothetical protein
VVGAGGSAEDFEERTEGFRFGLGWVAKLEGARVKWNFEGSRVALWSPAGPEYGTVEVLVDGKHAVCLDLRAQQTAASKVVWRSGKLKGRFHAIVLQATKGRIPVDCLDVED